MATIINKNNLNSTGFTVVELLIVIVVIAILATITIVAFNGVQERARASSAMSTTSQVVKKLELQNATDSAYPADLSVLGLPATEGVSYEYTPDGTASYCLTVTVRGLSYKASTADNTPTRGSCLGHGSDGVAAVTNLVQNPSLEVTGNGWLPLNWLGYIGRFSSAQAHTGTQSYELIAPSTGKDAYAEMQPYPSATNGKTYTISAYVYLTGTGSTHANGDTLFAPATGTSTGGAHATYDRSKLNQWQRISRTFTMTSNGTLRIRFNVPIGSTMYFDSVMLTESSLTEYGDGTSSNWKWNGTPNGSSSTGPAKRL